MKLPSLSRIAGARAPAFVERYAVGRPASGHGWIAGARAPAFVERMETFWRY